MITKKVVRVRAPEEVEEAPALSHRIDDEPPMVAGQYLDRATGEAFTPYDIPKAAFAKLAGEVRLDRRLVAMFLVGFVLVVALVLAVGYFVGRGESLQAARDAERAAAAPQSVSAAPAGAVAEGAAPAAKAAAEPEKRDPLSFYTELAEQKPDSAVALLKESDPKKFLAESEAHPIVTAAKADPGDRGLFTIQVSSFGSEEGANRLLDLLRKAEAPAYILPAKVEDKTWYRVRVGQYTSRAEAERAAKKVRDEQGLPAYVTPSQS